jgi:hypothetical protein
VYADQATLQAAITGASAGSTLDISGTDIQITTTLVVPAGITLSGPATFRANPSFSTSAVPATPLTPNLLMSRTYYPMVHLSGDGAAIKNVAIEGLQQPNSIPIDGIYSDATGTVTITNVTISDISYTGSGYGNGIVIVGTTSANITGSKIFRIGKNSIDFASGGNLTATNNTITGPGPLSNVAQNGIMLRSGTATLNNNKISDLKNANTQESSGITVIGDADITGDGNSVSGCDVGVDGDDRWTSGMGLPSGSFPTADLTNTTLSGNTTDVMQHGNAPEINVGIRAPKSGTMSVPVTGGFALIILGLLLAGLAVVGLRNRYQ